MAAAGDSADWELSNQRYLGAALTWLRLRLEHQARASRAGSPEEDSELQQAQLLLSVAEATEPPPAMAILAARFGLSRFERNVLLLCAAMELDTRIPELCARAQHDAARQFPTFALAFSLFEDAAWDALAPDRPLRRWHFLEVHRSALQPLTTSALKADERIVSYLKGLNYLDERLSPLVAPAELTSSVVDAVSESQAEVVEAIVRAVEGSFLTGRRGPVHLFGADSASKELVAQRVAQRLGCRMYRLPIELLPKDPLELETLARLWERESSLLPLALYFDARDIDGAHAAEASPSGPIPGTLRRFLSQSNSLVFLSTRELPGTAGAALLSAEVQKPTPLEQRAAWAAALTDVPEGTDKLLTSHFNLNVAAIEQIAREVSANGGQGTPAQRQDRVWRACLQRCSPELDVLAQRIEPKATWKDIVLDESALDLLRQIAHQVRERSVVYDDWGFRRKLSRGLGVNALFAGDSGTGKTMAAEVLANELNLNLYRIDLSGVVSKYIGETEKNLRRLFDAAENGGTLLFFDEADAIFGKRGEVKDSHDRYANIEINYLLQRIEAYTGVAILATNMRSAIDPAFLRRLRFVVSFPFPAVRDRKLIWERSFPAQAPLAELDWAWLARLNLSGGSIINIALNAAFRASRDGRAICMPVVIEAIRDEYRKLERPVNEADLRWKNGNGAHAAEPTRA